MSLILNQGLSSQYTFPRGFSIDAPPWAKRLNELERAYKHGAAITGDEMVKARPLRVWGVLWRTNRTAFQSALDSMEGACYLRASTFHATDHWTNRYLTVDCANFAIDYLVTLFAADVDVLFRVTDPFWYSDTLNSDLQSGLGSGSLTSIVNAGQIEVSPLIQIRVVTGTVTSIALTNSNDLFRGFTYTRNLTVGRGVRIRCAEGQVHRWTGTAYVDDLPGFTSGTFYRLQPGNNNIVLTLTGGGTIDITHYWRIKWLG